MNRAKEIFGFDDKWLITIGVPVITLIVNALIFGDEIVGSSRQFVQTCLGIGFVYTVVYWLVFREVVLYFGKKYPEPKHFGKRVLLQSLLVFALYFFIQTILDPILHGKLEETTGYHMEHHKIAMTVGSLLVTFLVLGIYITMGFYYQLQRTMVEKEQLLKESAQSQLETLKNQVNPHFFFNSLNTLSYLIPEDPAKAENFVQKLSKAYRYILEIRDRELTSVAEELGFLDSYNCLLSERFGDNIRIRINVPEEALSLQILPLSLQMLFENAIKHNIVSTQHPLHIEVSLEKGDRLVVKNNLQPKKQEQPSTKIGLENIKNRYRLLTKMAVDVIVTQQHFIVILPLLQSTQVEKKMVQPIGH